MSELQMKHYLNNRMFHSLYSYIVFEWLWQWHVHWYGIYLVFIYLICNSVLSWIFFFMYPMTSSISNGLVALYGSDERIINNNNILSRRDHNVTSSNMFFYIICKHTDWNSHNGNLTQNNINPKLSSCLWVKPHLGMCGTT